MLAAVLIAAALMLAAGGALLFACTPPTCHCQTGDDDTIPIRLIKSHRAAGGYR